MNTALPFRRWSWALAAALATCPAAAAQQAPFLLTDKQDGSEPLLRREHWLAGLVTPATLAAQPSTGSARVRMFRMLPGYSSDAVGLYGLDDNVPGDDPVVKSLLTRNPLDGPESNWLQISIGQDNPYFDLRRPGDPGGVGYHRLYTQMQLADWGSTSICLGLQAVTPAGQQDGGYQNGPTVLTPGLAVFQDLGNGLALHGFVGHDVRASMNSDFNENALRWGMGFQCPIPGLTTQQDRGFFLFMQALADYNYEGYRPNGRATNWEFVPGVHYRFNNNCWMSLGASRRGLLTCSWQF
jgi:hypothetical protein